MLRYGSERHIDPQTYIAECQARNNLADEALFGELARTIPRTVGH